MAILPSFYTGGIYLHNKMSERPEGSEDFFTASNSLAFSPDDGSEGYRQALVQLDQRIKDAMDIEKKFYQLFDVSDFQEWNRVYLGLIFDKDQKTNALIFNKEKSDETLQQQLLSIVFFKSPLRRIILSEWKTGRETLKKFIDNFTAWAQTNMSDEASTVVTKLQNNKDSITRGLMDAMFSTQGQGILTNLPTLGLSAKFTGRLAQIATKGAADIDQAKQAFLKEGTAEAKKQMNSIKAEAEDKFLKAVYQIFYKLNTNIDKGVRETIKFLEAGLDLAFFDNDQTKKTAYIADVAKTLRRVLKRDVRGNFYMSTSGAMGQAYTEVILKMALDSLDGEKAVLADLSSALYTQSRTKTKGQSPVDIAIKYGSMIFNIQIKNTVSVQTVKTKIRTAGGNIHYNMPAMLQDFFVELESRGIGGMDFNFIKYQLVNQLYRGGSDSAGFLTNLNMFLNSVVEHFIRGYQVEEVVEAIDSSGLNKMENHFILRPTMGLIPISNFLLAVKDVLSQGLSGQGFSGSGKILSVSTKSIDTGALQDSVNGQQMRQEKIDQIKRLDPSQRNTRLYPQSILNVGYKYGNELMAQIPSPDVSLLISFLGSQIQNIPL